MILIRRIYLLDNLSPEITAVTFAKTSRSPESFDVIAKGLSAEKSSQFSEKWVVGYGHSSVAEHAVLSIAVENVSRVAGEVIESARLASFTEKSTRYQKIGSGSFYIPTYVTSDGFVSNYKTIAEAMLQFYDKSYNVMKEYLSKIESDISQSKRKALDYARFVLPISTLTNIGITINARSLEHLITKMLSDQRTEIREIGKEIKEEAIKKVPTLLKYASESQYLSKLNRLSMERNHINTIRILTKNTLPPPNLLFGDFDKLQNIEKFIQFPYTDKNFYEIDQAHRFIDLIPEFLGSHDELPRELEHISFTFELTIDEGLFYELKRHRMCTLTPQNHSIRDGFYIPELFYIAELDAGFMELLDKVKEFYLTYMEQYPNEVEYILPNCTMRKMLFTVSLREFYHIYKLRTAENAHFAIQDLLSKMFSTLKNYENIREIFKKV